MTAPRFALPPQYDPHAVERPLYQRWLERGVFTARADSPKPPYVIVIPPPNVTAVLHMGQRLNNVTQDVLIRFERMRGRAALWLPGTDHAGIATQNVVERLVAKEGKTRFDLGRDKFVERVWQFVRETGPVILEQLKVIGCSSDWSRTRFTFDEAYSRSVREVFVRLWEEKLIYRGHRVIHWCPHCLTALSDEEAESKDTEGKLYYIRYPVEGGPQPFLTVATTRPETLLGDAAVAVNPKDARDAGAETARGPRPVRGARADRGYAEGAGPPREDRAAPARAAALLPLRHDRRAAALGPMVREDAAARRAGPRRLSPQRVSVDPRALARHLRALDGAHPGLEHLAPAVVGSPHPGVHLHEMQAPVGRSERPDHLPQVRRAGGAGSGRARHLVLVVALAVRDVRLAGAHAGPGALLSRPHPGHGAGDPLLLGGADAHVRLPLHGRPAVRDGLPAWYGARHAAPQDVEVARQRDRSARCGAVVRRRRAALDPDRGQLARRRRDPRSERSRDDLRSGPELREQALEHRSVHPGAAAGAGTADRCARCRNPAARRSVGAVPRAGDDPRSDRVVRAVPAGRGSEALLRLCVEGAGRLVRRGGQAAVVGRHRRRAFVLLRYRAAAVASCRAVHHRGAVAEASGSPAGRAARRGGVARAAGGARGPRGRPAVSTGPGDDLVHPDVACRVSRSAQGAARGLGAAQERAGAAGARGRTGNDPSVGAALRARV